MRARSGSLDPDRRLFSPSHIVAIDLNDSRLDAAKQFGAEVLVNNGHEDPEEIVRQITGD